MKIEPSTLHLIFTTLAKEGDPHRDYLSIMTFNSIGRVILDLLGEEEEESGFVYLLHCLRELLVLEHERLIEIIGEKNKQLFNLIEDEEDL